MTTTMTPAQIAKVRQHFAGQFPGQLHELDWIVNSSLPPRLVNRGHLTARDWYHAVRRMLSRAELQW